MDIVAFGLSDDLPPRVVDKLNLNFRRLARIVYQEEPSLYDALELNVPVTVDQGGTGTVGFPENAVLVGHGSEAVGAVAPGTGYLYSASEGATPVWQMVEAGDTNWFGAGTPTGSRDPSSSWTTEALKAEHAGDLYWNTSAGTLYYWAKTGSPAAWKWNQISIANAGDKTYTHTQSTAASTWTITHNLNKYPSVTVEDSAHNDVIGDITYNSLNQVTLTFTGAFAGWAYLN